MGRADRGELLTDYLGVSESQLTRAIERLIADGRYELAASLLDCVQGQFERDLTIQALQRRVYLKLTEKAQNTDPFKFILYALKAGEQVPQMSMAASTGR